MSQPNLMSGVQLLCVRRKSLTARLGHLQRPQPRVAWFDPISHTFESAALSLINLIKKFNLSFLPIICALRSWFGRMISESGGNP